MAIKQAREFIKENTEYDPTMKMWAELTHTPGIDFRHDLKNRRIIYALTLLGVEEDEARDFAYQAYNTPFRDAMYKYPIK